MHVHIPECGSLCMCIVHTHTDTRTHARTRAHAQTLTLIARACHPRAAMPRSRSLLSLSPPLSLPHLVPSLFLAAWQAGQGRVLGREHPESDRGGHRWTRHWTAHLPSRSQGSSGRRARCVCVCVCARARAAHVRVRAYLRACVCVYVRVYVKLCGCVDVYVSVECGSLTG